jgi:hypothetical protein
MAKSTELKNTKQYRVDSGDTGGQSNGETEPQSAEQKLIQTAVDPERSTIHGNTDLPLDNIVPVAGEKTLIVEIKSFADEIVKSQEAFTGYWLEIAKDTIVIKQEQIKYWQDVIRKKYIQRVITLKEPAIKRLIAFVFKRETVTDNKMRLAKDFIMDCILQTKYDTTLERGTRRSDIDSLKVEYKNTGEMTVVEYAQRQVGILQDNIEKLKAQAEVVKGSAAIWAIDAQTFKEQILHDDFIYHYCLARRSKDMEAMRNTQVLAERKLEMTTGGNDDDIWKAAKNVRSQ